MPELNFTLSFRSMFAQLAVGNWFGIKRDNGPKKKKTFWKPVVMYCSVVMGEISVFSFFKKKEKLKKNQG